MARRSGLIAWNTGYNTAACYGHTYIHFCRGRGCRDEAAGGSFRRSDARSHQADESMKQLLIFVLFAALLCWIMFSPIYKHVLIVRQAVLQQEVDYLLEVGASGAYGYIDESMQQRSMERIARFGMQSGSLRYEYGTTSGVVATDANAPVPRGTGISLSISYPYENLFLIDRLIGIAPISPNDRMSASGMKMSEYVPDS